MRSLTILFLITLSLTLMGCSHRSSLTSKKDLTAALREQPFTALHLFPESDRPSEAEFYLTPNAVDASNFYSLRRIATDPTSSVVKFEQEIGFVPLSKILEEPAYNVGEIQWYLVIRKLFDGFGFEIAWFSRTGQNINFRQLDTDVLQILVADKLCASDIDFDKQPCRRVVSRYFWRHFAARVDGSQPIELDSIDGMRRLLKLCFEGRRAGQHEPLSAARYDTEDWKFTELSTLELQEVMSGKVVRRPQQERR